MKKHNFILTALIAVAVIAMAIVSCKKETENTLNQKNNIAVQAFDFRQIEDINAYLKDFKAKMTESKDNEAFSLDDAAWHLASLANRDFCRINVEYNDVQFDTVAMTVNITDGAVLLSDINAAYEQMCNEIQQFIKGFNHNNQNLYFINMFINANGNAKIALTTTFTADSKNWEDYQWYFPDDWELADVCDYYFNFAGNTQYPWNGFGKTELERILNIYEHHNLNPDPYATVYYTPTQAAVFEYSTSNTDPYGSPFDNNSRVFAKINTTNSNNYTYNLSVDEMCYCLDSYLGLGYDYLAANSIHPLERPANWVVKDSTAIIHGIWYKHYHELTVQYGRLNADPYNPDPGN